MADGLPPPPDWAYEPKWDGFRVIAWSSATGPDGRTLPPRLDSRNGKPLLRYFPELEPALGRLPSGTVVDGELVVVVAGRLDFDALQNRIHPAESRARRLAAETPARIALFDLLALAGDDLREQPFRERRSALETLAEDLEAGSDPSSPWLLSPITLDPETARRWYRDLESAGFDGIVAKSLDHPYREGKRDMVKIKHRRTVDCVVGGYRIHKDGKRVGSLLLGLYDRAGGLHFIGHCSSFSTEEATLLLRSLRDLESQAADLGSVGFGEHARNPGRQSRWSGGKDLDFSPVPPVLVVEVSYDQLTGDRFRHATRFERWRPDKEPRDCTLDQLERPPGPDLARALERAHSRS